tara:strand:- start:352 stop:561 length:210 start_codon:yes stop_codon:yes gene_type:complete
MINRTAPQIADLIEQINDLLELKGDLIRLIEDCERPDPFDEVLAVRDKTMVAYGLAYRKLIGQLEQSII